MYKLFRLIKFAAQNFAPLLVFYAANHFFGLKAALLFSVSWTILDLLLHRFQKRPVSAFFKFSATLTLAFGLVDLYLQQSFLFKFEAVLTNVMVGLLFGSSLWSKKPIIREFAEAQGRISKNISPDSEFYFKFLTAVWSIYSFAKAGFYFWVAIRYSLEEGLLVRAVLGNTTFYGLLFASIFGYQPIMNGLSALRCLPSSNRQNAGVVVNSREC